MAIHDVDKSSGGRETPMPNSHDEQGLARMAAGTNSTNYVSGASSGQFFSNINGIKQPIAAGQVTLVKSANNDSGLVSIAHQLSFVPGVDYYVTNGATVSMAPYIFFVTSGAGTGLVDTYLTVSADATFVNFTLHTPNVTGGSYALGLSVTIVYYLYFQNAQVPPFGK